MWSLRRVINLAIERYRSRSPVDESTTPSHSSHSPIVDFNLVKHLQEQRHCRAVVVLDASEQEELPTARVLLVRS